MSGSDRGAARVARAAAEHGISIQVRHHPEGTKTAEDAARAVGCEVDQIVKSLVFVAGEEPVVVLMSGSHRVDTAKLAGVAGAASARRASPDEAREATGFPIGGTPPFGHIGSLRVFLDASLLERGEVWCAAGTPSTVFPISPEALVKAASATVENLHEEE